jgi:hypothetical protein
MSMLATIQIINSAERRQSPRHAVESGSTLRTESCGALDVVVTNLSETGCAIKVPVTLMIGTHISIGLVGFGTFEAKVVRADGDIVGCEFVRPIGRHVIDSAFETTTVIFPNGLALAPTAETGFPEPDIEKWSIGYRALFLFGSSALLWALIAGMTY